jgi:hypothetical protein
MPKALRQLVNPASPLPRVRPAPRVALVSGFWGQNIGNAFFNIGGKWILQQVFGEDDVDFVQDQPGYRTFHRQASGNPPNDFNLLRFLDVDYVVLQGPMLTQTFSALWRDAFHEYRRRGTRVILLGAALFKFTREEIAAAREFLREYPPAIISTRDHDSYEAIKDCAPFTYSGIDSGFFAPKVYTPFRLACPDYVVLNFDRFPEPDVRLDDAGAAADHTFEALGMQWRLRIPRLQQRISLMGKWQAYFGWMLDCRPLPTTLGAYAVIRPEHRFNPHITWKIYRHPNAIASDEPFTYFTVYSGSSLTLSDRVHACVATLAYGKPAMLFTPTPRARLFDRLGLRDIRRRPVTLDAQRLEEERQNELAFLSDAVTALRRS